MKSTRRWNPASRFDGLLLGLDIVGAPIAPGEPRRPGQGAGHPTSRAPRTPDQAFDRTASDDSGPEVLAPDGPPAPRHHRLQAAAAADATLSGLLPASPGEARRIRANVRRAAGKSSASNGPQSPAWPCRADIVRAPHNSRLACSWHSPDATGYFKVPGCSVAAA